VITVKTVTFCYCFLHKTAKINICQLIEFIKLPHCYNADIIHYTVYGVQKYSLFISNHVNVYVSGEFNHGPTKKTNIMDQAFFANGPGRHRSKEILTSITIPLTSKVMFMYLNNKR